MAIPAHAETHLTGLQAIDGPTTHWVSVASQSQTTESVHDNHALSGEQRVAISDTGSLGPVHTELEHVLGSNDQPLASLQEIVQQQVSELLRGTSAVAHDEVYSHADAGSAVSAEMLQAAMAGVALQSVER